MIFKLPTLDVRCYPISASSANANEIVAAQANKAIVVLAYTLIASGTVNAKWQSGSTDLSGLLYLIANVGASPAQGQYPQVYTGVGEALNLHLSGAVAVGGHITVALIGTAN